MFFLFFFYLFQISNSLLLFIYDGYVSIFREWLFGSIDKNKALTCTAQIDHILGNDQHDFSVNKNARSMKDALALILGITRRRIEECRERFNFLLWDICFLYDAYFHDFFFCS